MVLVVAFTSVAADKVTLERPLHPAWHVAVETSQADGHADGLAAAIHHALLSLGSFETEIDAADDRTRALDVWTHDCVETAILHWTVGRIAGYVATALLPEYFLACRHS